MLISVLTYGTDLAQSRIVTGIVVDSATQAPLQNVSVSLKNTGRGTLTNLEGKFRLTAEKNFKKLMVSITGYHPITVPLTDESLQMLNIRLSKAYTQLQDVVVNGKRGKYRNKHNPAVELIRQVIANKSKNGPAAYDYSSSNQYEKLKIFVDRLPRLLVDNKFLKKFHFMFENIDSSVVPGKKLIPVYLEEVFSHNFYRKNPQGTKKFVWAHNRVDYGEYVDMKGISTALNRLYENVNIYDNSISLFTIRFISPVADLAPTFYMYFIQDTVVENGEKLVQLYFTPRNPEDQLLKGTLYITLDGNYAIRKVDLGVSKRVNLNWVSDFNLHQDFSKGALGRYHLAASDMVAYFSPFPKAPGIFGERMVTIGQVTDSIVADAVFRGIPVDTLVNSTSLADTVWHSERPVPLTVSETTTYRNSDSLRHMHSYHRLMDYTTMFTAGYKSAGDFDIGPIGNFYSFNPIEGPKFHFGGRTNVKLSTRYFGESYIAYGFRDGRWKYYLSGTYSFNNRSIYKFPVHYLQASYLHDTRNLGQENIFAQGNGFLTSFGRGNNTKWLYNDIFRLHYLHESNRHFSFELGMKYWQQQPAGSVNYIYQPALDRPDTVRRLVTSELSVAIRWAPHEQFYEGRSFRADIPNQHPIISLQYARGIKGFLSGGYNYNALHANIFKRSYAPPFGYSDITVDAGYLGGNLPYPLLVVHPANQSYFYFMNAYNLMNIGEFVSDHYAAINIDQFFEGFFFNKIPLLKKLRLREVVAAKLLYGGVRDENNPDINPEQMKFPLTGGLRTTYVLGSAPYLEASAGIYNIFSVIRLDVVKRFTYLSHPGISGIGLRISANFNF